MTVKTLDSQNFESTVLAPGVVVVDFWASWCGPCRAFAPIYEQVASEYEDVTFTKLNTEENRELSGALGIRSIPTLMIFRDGVVVFNQAGMLPKKSLMSLVEQVKTLDMDEVRRQIAEQQPAAAHG